ncbi:hypothetical protein LINPERHAP2_LOCUS10198 [Linum perenne]
MVSEARALLEAVSFASRVQSPCTVFSDCLLLVASLKAQISKWPWDCYGLLGAITDILSTSPSISVRFTPRKENKFADWVARSARQNRLPPDWLHWVWASRVPPPQGPFVTPIFWR